MRALQTERGWASEQYRRDAAREQLDEHGHPEPCRGRWCRWRGGGIDLLASDAFIGDRT